MIQYIIKQNWWFCPIGEKTRMPKNTGSTRTQSTPQPRTRRTQTPQLCKYHKECNRATPGGTHQGGKGLWYHPKSNEKQKGRMARK